MARIINIEGIGKTFAEKLNAVGIKTTEGLLEACYSRKARAEMAERTGISEKLILEWVTLADLFRVKGVGEQFSDLLEEAGVDTVAELAQRNPENLYTKIVQVNGEKNLVNRVPHLSEVQSRVEQARTMPRKVE